MTTTGRTTFEYRVLVEDRLSVERLNQLGAEGWQLCSHDRMEASTLRVYVFIRPLPPPGLPPAMETKDAARRG